MSIFAKIRKGLEKSRTRMARSLEAVFGAGQRTEQLELLEEFLILADVGPAATKVIIDEIQTVEIDGLMGALKEKLFSLLSCQEGVEKRIKIFVGINGTGKTTSVGKLCHHLHGKGKSVFVIGADTFRPAADMQLEEWSRRTGTPYILGKPGSDPGAVVFDGLNSSAARNADYVICDTAGRLHVNKNLMQELEKIIRVAVRVSPDSVEVLLTLDAGTGQNALEQMEAFKKWVNPTGIILTKLDGSAKGGIAIALAEKYNIPIKYVGVGEGLDDLVPFDARAYIDSLLPSIEAKPPS